MFEVLFHAPARIDRHEKGPYPRERFQFLTSLMQIGYKPHTLYVAAHELLRVAIALKGSYSGLRLTPAQVDRAISASRGSKDPSPCTVRYRRRIAHQWLRHLGLLEEPAAPVYPELEEYCRWCQEERGLTVETISGARHYATAFLIWLGRRSRQLHQVRAHDVDRYLKYGTSELGWNRRSTYNVAKALRGFFRFCTTRGWADPKLASTIRGPRQYSLQQIPVGPTWAAVEQALTGFDDGHASDIRNRAIFMLLAIYGLRSIEVCRLRLEDIDWEHDLLRIRRGKHNRISTFPLLPSVGEAVLSYLQRVRPRSTERAIFLNLTFPHRPISRGVNYHIAHNRLVHVAEPLPRRGTHALRHACATHLLARGFSLKEIGDQLGHRRALSTRVYAKVDKAGLRRVAAFDTGVLS